MSINKILFVCTGNSCRSPMAEGVLKHLLKNDPQYTVLSAGTSGLSGMEASYLASAVMKSMGIDISSHRSRALTKELIHNMDLVLCMALEHKAMVLRMSPEAKDKTFLLLNYANNAFESPMEVADPIGGPEHVYRECAHILYDAIDDIVRRRQKPGETENHTK